MCSMPEWFLKILPHLSEADIKVIGAILRSGRRELLCTAGEPCVTLRVSFRQLAKDAGTARQSAFIGVHRLQAIGVLRIAESTKTHGIHGFQLRVFAPPGLVEGLTGAPSQNGSPEIRLHPPDTSPEIRLHPDTPDTGSPKFSAEVQNLDYRPLTTPRGDEGTRAKDSANAPSLATTVAQPKTEVPTAIPRRRRAPVLPATAILDLEGDAAYMESLRKDYPQIAQDKGIERIIHKATEWYKERGGCQVPKKVIRDWLDRELRDGGRFNGKSIQGRPYAANQQRRSGGSREGSLVGHAKPFHEAPDE